MPVVNRLSWESSLLIIATEYFILREVHMPVDWSNANFLKYMLSQNKPRRVQVGAARKTQILLEGFAFALGFFWFFEKISQHIPNSNHCVFSVGILTKLNHECFKGILKK